jgi:hypothetical protein
MQLSPVAWLPLVLAGLALLLAGGAMLMAMNARKLATPTPAMQRLQEKLSGPEGEQLLAELQSQLLAHSTRLRDVESLVEQASNQLRSAVQKVGLERFNSEQGLGGNLSFALVMLDSRSHGVCLTSIHNLEAGRIFVRGIIGGKTDHPLLPEEQAALDQALKS